MPACFPLLRKQAFLYLDKMFNSGEGKKGRTTLKFEHLTMYKGMLHSRPKKSVINIRNKMAAKKNI